MTAPRILTPDQAAELLQVPRPHKTGSFASRPWRNPGDLSRLQEASATLSP